MFVHVVLAGLLAVASANVVNDCYRCSSWDAVGRGFIPSDDPSQCNVYRECWKDYGSGVITGPIYRFCAPGTWVGEFDAVNGAPCTLTTCSQPPCSAASCDIPVPPTHQSLPCHFVQGNPQWIILRELPEGGTVHYGTCGTGGYFNDTEDICTCTSYGPYCSCRVDIPLSDSIDDVSCHKSWVAQAGMPAVVTIDSANPSGPDTPTGSGVFSGFNVGQNNGGHLTTYTLDGAFAGAWVHQLTFTAWFRLDALSHDERVGVVTLGDCAEGPAFAIWVDHHHVVAHLELLDENNNINDHTITQTADVHVDIWYFVSVSYDNSATNGFSLRVFDEAQYALCFANQPNDCPVAAPSLDVHGTVTPRGCGLSIGSTGSENSDELFIGNICGVKVIQEANIFACKGGTL